MAAEDWIPDGEAPDGVPTTCKRCGASNLDWVHTGERWRLVDGRGRFHVCKQYDAADDFGTLA